MYEYNCIVIKRSNVTNYTQNITDI